ncbi:hypothetical protein P7F88_04535 [Vibrio hannami]|uniref:hypothetical protein n=1 Tax=Vibrio hannami TaxID=2717094 RepID=UPI00240F8935|nr:hypothetical protein [Vibrio hannami]MDG3085407.1 hypothetical protein [Vibrio hannami]
MQLVNNQIKRCLVSVLLVVSPCAVSQIPGLEPEKQWALNGYVKYMPSYTINDAGDNYLDHLIHQRFNFEYRFSSETRVNLGLRNRVIKGDSVDQPLYSELVSTDFGYFDLSKMWHSKNDVLAVSQLDRLSINHDTTLWNSRLGRFRINWSMNSIWNPNDIFNAYSIYDFDYEEKPGTDAVAITRKLDYAAQLDFVYSPVKSDAYDNRDSWAFRYLFNQNGWDAQLISGRASYDNVYGVGIAGDHMGAGIRAEISYFDRTEAGPDNETQSNTVVASVEADYNMGSENNIVIRSAYLFVSEPQEPLNANTYLNLPLTAKTLSFTHHTFYADLGFDTSPLNRVVLSGVYYQDNSYYLSLTDTYSLSNEWQLYSIVQRYSGRGDSLFSFNKNTSFYLQVRWDY